MTIEDVTVIGLGSVALLCLFLFASIVMNRVDVWGVIRRYVVVRLSDEPVLDEIAPDFADETNSETDEIPQRVGEIHAESFTLGETTALARLVAAGKLGLTDAVKTGADAKSGEKYQRRSRDIKVMVDRLQQKYPHITPEQEALRKQLKLGS